MSVQRATAFPPLGSLAAKSLCVCPLVLRRPNGSSEYQNRSFHKSAERSLRSSHSADISAAHLSRQVCGIERKSQQHRPHRDRRSGRCARGTGEWTEEKKKEINRLELVLPHKLLNKSIEKG